MDGIHWEFSIYWGEGFEFYVKVENLIKGETVWIATTSAKKVWPLLENFIKTKWPTVPVLWTCIKGWKSPLLV
jgi:phosphatidate phosphatase APP1